MVPEGLGGVDSEFFGARYFVLVSMASFMCSLNFLRTFLFGARAYLE